MSYLKILIIIYKYLSESWIHGLLYLITLLSYVSLITIKCLRQL